MFCFLALSPAFFAAIFVYIIPWGKRNGAYEIVLSKDEGKSKASHLVWHNSILVGIRITRCYSMDCSLYVFCEFIRIITTDMAIDYYVDYGFI
jgi:hypothetical protein